MSGLYSRMGTANWEIFVVSSSYKSIINIKGLPPAKITLIMKIFTTIIIYVHTHLRCSQTHLGKDFGISDDDESIFCSSESNVKSAGII